MNVLLAARRTLHMDAGGDTVQIMKYAEYLEPLGIRTALALTPEPPLDDADIVHGFNLQVTDQTYRLLRRAKQAGKTVVLSPIYWPMREFDRYRIRQARAWGNTPWKEWARGRWDTALHALQDGWRGERRAWGTFARLLARGKTGLQRDCLRLADRILVSAPSEKEALVREFRLPDPGKVGVVPNGVEPFFEQADPAAFARRLGARDYVLCVGRLEPHKNQAAVARAARDLPVDLVMIGSQRHPRYLDWVRHEAGPRTHILGPVPQTELASAYAGAKVHVLASWFDIPGLVTLEAGLAGCNLVTTRNGSAPDYLGPHARYVNPGDENDIRAAIASALEAPRDGAAQRWLSGRYAWTEIARQLAEEYRIALAGRGHRG